MNNLLRLNCTALFFAISLSSASLFAQDPQPVKPAPVDKVQGEQPKTAKVNINKATAVALQALPDVDAALAQKIIDARPYKSMADFAKVVPAKQLAKIAPMIALDDGSPDDGSASPYPADMRKPQVAPSDAKVNINKATAVALQALPDVNAALAQKIIDARPYKSMADFAKVVPAKQLAKIAPLIILDDGSPGVGPADVTGGRGIKEPVKVEINKAPVAQLEPLVGTDVAKLIVEARPFKTMDELAKIVPAQTMAKIAPLISLNGKSVQVDQAGAGQTADTKVEINKATEAAIADLPDVTTEMAKQIVAARPFKTADDLAKIVPAQTMAKIAPIITIDGAQVWSGPPMAVAFGDNATLMVALLAPTSGYELRVDNVVLAEGLATVQCTMTAPHSGTTKDMPEKIMVEVVRDKLGATTRKVTVTVATVERGVQYFRAPDYVTVTSVLIPTAK